MLDGKLPYLLRQRVQLVLPRTLLADASQRGCVVRANEQSLAGEKIAVKLEGL